MRNWMMGVFVLIGWIVAPFSAHANIGCLDTTGVTTLEQELFAGYDELNQGDPEMAKRIFKGIISKDEDYYKAYNALGIVAIQQEDFQEALRQVNRSLQINPNYDSGLATKAEVYLHLHQVRAAEVLLQKGLEINPKNARIISDLGLCDYYNNDLSQALLKFKKAISIDARNTYIYYNMGTVEYHQKNYSNAIKHLTHALELGDNYNSYRIFINRGASKYYLGDYSGAVQDYSKALVIKPENPSVIINVGMVYYIMEDYETAIQFFNRALKYSPDNKAAFYNRAMANYNLKKYSESVPDFEQSCDLGFKDACDMIKMAKRRAQKSN